MSSFTDEQFKQMAEATAVGVKAALEDLSVPPKQHAEDHHWTKAWRRRMRIFIQAMIAVMGASAGGGLLWAFRSWIISMPGAGH